MVSPGFVPSSFFARRLNIRNTMRDITTDPAVCGTSGRSGQTLDYGGMQQADKKDLHYTTRRSQLSFGTFSVHVALVEART